MGGLAFSQLVTLYVTPVVYTYLDSLRNRKPRTRTAHDLSPGMGGGPVPVAGD